MFFFFKAVTFVIWVDFLQSYSVLGKKKKLGNKMGRVRMWIGFKFGAGHNWVGYAVFVTWVCNFCYLGRFSPMTSVLGRERETRAQNGSGHILGQIGSCIGSRMIHAGLGIIGLK